MRNTVTQQEEIEMMNTEDVIAELNDQDAFFQKVLSRRIKFEAYSKFVIERRNLLIAELERRELILEPA